MKNLRADHWLILRSLPSDADARWDARVSAFRDEGRRLAAQGHPRCVMLGDSLVEGFPHVLLHAADRRWLNRGIASDHLGGGQRSMLARLDHATLLPAPTSLLIAGGINDLGDLPSQPERVVQRLAELIAKAKEIHPSTRLALQSLLPTRGAYAQLNPAIRQVNSGIAELAKAEGAAHVDVHRLLVDDTGQLRKAYSRDGLHLRLPGYAVWAYALRRLNLP
jgi:lysophospholipase L1-like esterase